jgi:hypothetical protein
MEISGEVEYEVQEVRAVKKVRNRLFYRIQWVGYDEDPEWYPASNLKNSPHQLRDFHLANPDQPGPPQDLDKWLKAWESEEDRGGFNNDTEMT